MFRAAASGPYDDVIAKATDENLTSEDWSAILEVCDKVSSDPNGPKEAVQSIIKRLAHRNANVQLYALELAHALCQNCGKNMHREVSSRAFTDSLLRLANDRNTHSQVKSKILERMGDWSDMFTNDPDLGIMYDAYYRLKQTNPTLHPPSAPQKQGLTQSDRQKEDDELQMALKLSLQEEERKKSVTSGSGAAPGPSGQPQESSTTPAPSAGTTAATVSRVRALFDFAPSEPGELEFKRGDVIAVLESVYKDWWRGSLKGKTGIFPLNYVEKLTDPTPDELQREAQMEAEVFAEIKNVEKLLTLLSTSNSAPREEDNEEISKLYHQTLAIRPKLIKLIEKYSQKKDDFTQLNEKFIKARRDYEALLESSMSHPPQHSYQQYAMRPGPPAGQGYPSGAGGYPGQAPPQDPHQRYYTPGPPGDRPPYQSNSPPPNFQTPGPGSSAPFYVAGSEVGQTYPPRNQTPGMTPGGPSGPMNTGMPAQQPPTHYTPYSQPQGAPAPGQAPPEPYSQPGPGGAPRPQSTYGAQELATSVYDSPIAPHNPQSAGNFSSSVYSEDEPANNRRDSYPPPGPYSTGHPMPPSQYQSYNPGEPSAPSAPPAGGPDMMPPPLQPGGAAYDSRHSLPSQGAPASGGQPQYKPYMPPQRDGADDGSSYYRT